MQSFSHMCAICRHVSFCALACSDIFILPCFPTGAGFERERAPLYLNTISIGTCAFSDSLLSSFTLCAGV